MTLLRLVAVIGGASLHLTEDDIKRMARSFLRNWEMRPEVVIGNTSIVEVRSAEETLRATNEPGAEQTTVVFFTWGMLELARFIRTEAPNARVIIVAGQSESIKRLTENSGIDFIDPMDPERDDKIFKRRAI